MKRLRRKSQRGIALLIVLIGIAILGVMTVDFSETSEVYLATTVNQRDAVRAEYLARSGINLSRLLLSLQPLLPDGMSSLVINYADMIISLFTDPEGGGLVTDMIGLNLEGAEGLGLGMGDNEELEIKIIDEDSKLNINWPTSAKAKQRLVQQLSMLMAPIQYDELFDLSAKMGTRSMERQDVVCEILDWTDPDEELCDGAGGEDPSMYQRGVMPYERKNAPFDSLEELHLVGGVGDDFWSAFVDPDPENVDARVMTVWGKGKVNVNSAPTQVLFPIVCMLAADVGGVSPCLNPVQFQNIAMVLNAAVMMRTFMPFGSVQEFVAALQNPASKLFLPLPGIIMPQARQAREMLGTKSTVFSIFATGTVGRVTKRIHAVIDTEGQDMLNPSQSVAASGGKILYWRME